jgi:hypothetical protein
MQGTVLQNLPTQRFDTVLLANKFRPSDSHLSYEELSVLIQRPVK